MLAVYELVRFLLANKRQIVYRDWLAEINIMAAEWTDAACVDYTNYASQFYLYITHDCIQTDFGRLRFHLRAIKQITAAAMSQSTIFNCCPTKCCRVTCWPTSVDQQLLTTICWWSTILFYKFYNICRSYLEAQSGTATGTCTDCW